MKSKAFLLLQKWNNLYFPNADYELEVPEVSVVEGKLFYDCFTTCKTTCNKLVVPTISSLCSMK